MSYILGPHTLCRTKLLSNVVFNYEENNQYTVIIRVADHAGLSKLSSFNISIEDRNDQPTNLTVEGELMVFVQENSVDKLIGEFETTDEDIGQSYLYGNFASFHKQRHITNAIMNSTLLLLSVFVGTK